jgi:hypothetical protein
MLLRGVSGKFNWNINGLISRTVLLYITLIIITILKFTCGGLDTETVQVYIIYVGTDIYIYI